MKFIKKNWFKLIIIALIIILSVSCYYLIFLPTQKMVTESQNNAVLDYNEIFKGDSDIVNVELRFNNRTGELFSIYDYEVEPHTCVWTLWGSHGNYTTLITRVDVIVGHVGYVGHVIAKNYFNVLKKSEEFWPGRGVPKTPIYMTCIDSNNKIYKGAINN